jgi:hypothetical protein
MSPWLKRALAGLTGAAALAAFYALAVERMRVRLDSFTVAVDKAGLTSGGLTILHLSDFHFRAGGWIQERKIASLRRALRGQEFDLVAETGDLIHEVAGLPAALALLKGLRPRLGSFSVPGNHDYCEYSMWGMFGETGSKVAGILPGGLANRLGQVRAFTRKVLNNELVRLPVAYNDIAAIHAALGAVGVRPLVNGAAHVQADGVDLWVAGVDDFTEGRPDLQAALAGVPAGAPLILLSHNPDVWLDPLVSRADLVLAGHTHGGQVRLPLVGAAHTQGTHLTRRRPAGWFRRGGTRMFVTRGLGESIPLRFGAGPQAALIRLVPVR